MSGKGSRRRPGTGYADNYDRIFNKESNMNDYVLRRAAAAYQRNNGVLPLDIMTALDSAGLLIEDVINYLETDANG